MKLKHLTELHSISKEEGFKEAVRYEFRILKYRLNRLSTQGTLKMPFYIINSDKDEIQVVKCSDGVYRARRYAV